MSTDLASGHAAQFRSARELLAALKAVDDERLPAFSQAKMEALRGGGKPSKR